MPLHRTRCVQDPHLDRIRSPATKCIAVKCRWRRDNHEFRFAMNDPVGLKAPLLQPAIEIVPCFALYDRKVYGNVQRPRIYSFYRIDKNLPSKIVTLN